MTNFDPTQVIINSDMGEGIGLHSFGNDESLMPLVSAINLACGWHAGDPFVMRDTVALAKEHSVAVGAHPGLPDITGFGRRRMALLPEEVAPMIRYQVGALVSFLEAEGMKLNHIKPHGSFYGMLAGDEDLMRQAAEVNAQYGVPFFGLAGTAHESVCQEKGVEFIPELYVDLNYDDHGGLIIERKPHMADPEKVKDRVRKALAGRPFESVNGQEITIDFKSICVHSDTANAPIIAQAVQDVIAELAS